MQLAIKVITYLQDADYEDNVIDILRGSFGDDLLIQTRALTVNDVVSSLKRIITNEDRWILIHDFQSFPAEINRELTRLSNLIAISLVEFRFQSPSELQKFVARSLRSFDSEKVIRKKAMFRPELLVVTGTTGAPGITTVTLNLGYELSREQNVNILDANYFRKDIAFLMGGKRGKSQTKLDKRLTIATEIEDLDDSGLITVAVLGSVANLGVAFSDRRAPSRNYVDLLESAGKILFLMQPENNHMFELEMFLEMIENQALSAKPYFLMNKLGNSRRERSIYKRFQARIGGHPSNFLPFDFESLDRAKSGYCAIAEVAPRGRLRKSLLQLAQQIQPNVQ